MSTLFCVSACLRHIFGEAMRAKPPVKYIINKSVHGSYNHAVRRSNDNAANSADYKAPPVPSFMGDRNDHSGPLSLKKYKLFTSQGFEKIIVLCMTAPSIGCTAKGIFFFLRLVRDYIVYWASNIAAVHIIYTIYSHD